MYKIGKPNLGDDVNIAKEIIDNIKRTFVVIFSLGKGFTVLYEYYVQELRKWQQNSSLLLYKIQHLKETNLELGLYHLYKHNLSDALTRFQLLQLFCRRDPMITYNIGRCYFLNKKYAKASKYLNKSIELQEDFPEARYFLQKINCSDVIRTIPQNLVKEKFEYLAQCYVIEHIIKKKYQGHKLIMQEIASYFGNQIAGIDILDIGCGTGICGHFLKSCTIGRTITGIDLAKNMTKITRACTVDDYKVYDVVTNINVLTFLQNCTKKFDLILAIETFNYISDLYEILLLCKQVLQEKGLIIMLLQQHKEKDCAIIPEDDCFAYKIDYIKSLVKSLNFTVNTIRECCVRSNSTNIICSLSM